MIDELSTTGIENSSNARPSNQIARPIVYKRRTQSYNPMSDIRVPARPSQINSGLLPKVQPVVKIPTRSVIDKKQETQKQEVQHTKKLFKRNKMALTFSSLAVMAFVAGIGIGISNLWLNNQTKARVSALANGTSTNKDAEVPSETVVNSNDLNNYKVAADQARILIIPKIGVKARVLQIGVMSNNTLMAPNNIYDTGWYSGSAKPDKVGAVVIDGHVHGSTKPGVFANLKELKVDDKIQIERGDHKVINYKIVKTQAYNLSKIDMAAVMTTTSSSGKGLNLITCTGSVNPTTSEYNQRLVVFAVQQ